MYVDSVYEISMSLSMLLRERKLFFGRLAMYAVAVSR